MFILTTVLYLSVIYFDVRL